MGTRHLICVVKDGQFKVAQYGQWDGYLEGQGVSVMEFLRGKKNRKNLEKGLEYVSWITDEEFNAFLKEAEVPESGWMDMEQAEKWQARHYELSRDCSSDILPMIANNAVSEKPRQIKLSNSITFASDSLFCEWAYVIDFDTNQLEIYKGFNKKPTPLGQRFSDYPIEETTGGKYYPIREFFRVALDAIPPVKTFIKQLVELSDMEDQTEEGGD
jgi:hypothetical protein